MPRAKYRITEEDFVHASFYLGRKLQTHDIEFADDVSPPEAKQDFSQATQHKRKQVRVQETNAWCEKYLNRKEWERLKTAIRKRRERWSRYNDLKSITISARAHQLLSNLAKRDEVTFSEVLEHYLAKGMNSGRGHASPKRKSLAQ
jgi:macrodomain Ter protein organizer (MatP/YcbG family)